LGSIANAGGRLLWGILADHSDYKVIFFFPKILSLFFFYHEKRCLDFNGGTYLVGNSAIIIA